MLTVIEDVQWLLEQHANPYTEIFLKYCTNEGYQLIYSFTRLTLLIYLYQHIISSGISACCSEKLIPVQPYIIMTFLVEITTRPSHELTSILFEIL